MPVITQRLLEAVKADGKLRIIRDDKLTGFGVQVTPNGRISYCVTYTVGTKSVRRVIGRFSLTPGGMSVDRARRTAMVHLANAAKGDDPLPVADRYPTTAALFDVWMERHVNVNLGTGTARAYRECFDTHCRKPFGHLPPSKLTYDMVSNLHTDLKPTPSAANHMVRTMRAMLSWAAKNNQVVWKTGNPARGHTLHTEKPSDRILSVPEIRAFITELPKAAMDANTRRMLMLGLLLGQRPVEVSSMRKANVDLTAATWLNDENKSDRPHVVPLPPWSRDIIQEALGSAKGAYMFPSPIGDPTSDDAEPVKPHALATALRRAQRPVDAKGKPAKATEDDEWVFDFRDRADKPNPISPHDLRRTCSSYLELLGHGDFVRGAILNHSNKRNVTAKHYSAADLLKLKRTALLQWEAALRQIMAGKDPFTSMLEDDRAEEARVLGLVPTAPAQD